MNLLLDIGNTHLRWTPHLGDALGEVGTVRHGGVVPPGLRAAWESLEPPDRVLVGNVGGAQVGAAVIRVAQDLWGIEVELVAVQAACLGLRVAYADPSRLGVDRWLALLGVPAGRCGGALVIDVGTAVTYDLLRADGQHLGGLILPGIGLMREALLQGTRIPPLGLETRFEVSLARPWGADTASAIGGGGIQALGALADRLYDRLLGLSGPRTPDENPPRLLLTGGDAERLVPAIGRPLEVRPDLVLQGLARLAQEGC